jgi:hypothetical protein
MTEEKSCKRCGVCCRVIPLSTAHMSPEYRAYLLNRGLKEDQGFILIPHDCQHLQFTPENCFMPDLGGEWFCDIYYDPARPKVCQKFHGQKRIGSAIIYIPPGCGYRKDKVE